MLCQSKKETMAVCSLQIHVHCSMTFSVANYLIGGNNNFSSTRTTLPSVNIMENPENFMVEVAAPGMEKQDFQISLDGNLLTISSSKKDQKEENNSNYTRREFSYQSFSRSFELPKDLSFPKT